VLYSAALGFVKDDASFFVAANHHLGIERGSARVLLLDDDSSNVAQARQSGWVRIHFDHTGSWVEEVDAALLRHSTW
jgi:FMN phosphatase YigB (HAD superfamily)